MNPWSFPSPGGGSVRLTAGTGRSRRAVAAVDLPTSVLAEASDAVLAQHVVGIAVGILLAQRRCSPHRAMGILIDIATRSDRSVVDEAYRVVENQARRSPPPVESDPGRARFRSGAVRPGLARSATVRSARPPR